MDILDMDMWIIFKWTLELSVPLRVENCFEYILSQKQKQQKKIVFVIWVNQPFIKSYYAICLCRNTGFGHQLSPWMEQVFVIIRSCVSVSSLTYLEQDLDHSVDHAHPPAQEGEEGDDELDEVVW